jgi:hypothetical protein
MSTRKNEPQPHEIPTEDQDKIQKKNQDIKISLSLTPLTENNFYKILFKNPLKRSHENIAAIEAAIETSDNPELRALQLAFIGQINKPGHLWSEEETRRMEIFVNLPSVRLYFLSYIAKKYLTFKENKELLKDGWQAFCSPQEDKSKQGKAHKESKLRTHLKGFDPTKSSMGHWLKLAIKSHFYDHYQFLVKSYEKGVNRDSYSLQDVENTDEDAHQALHIEYKEKTKTHDFLENIENEQLLKTYNYFRTHMLTDDEKIIFDTPYFKYRLLEDPQNTNRNVSIKIAELMNQQGRLTAEGLPYTPVNIRGIFCTIKNKFEAYLINSAVVSENWQLTRNKTRNK